jgi:NADH-quinone oxidoreductase subunit F
MSKLRTAEDLKCFREEACRSVKSREEMTTRIIVGAGTCGIAAGAHEVLQAILDEVAKHDVEVNVTTVGCIGMCSMEPLVDIVKPGRPRISYKNVTPQTALELINDYVVGDDPRPDLALAVIGEDSFDNIPAWGEVPFFGPQRRIVLHNCGFIDPEFTARAPGDVKYVVCNADEGDPGAFMDRSVIEGDPHSVLEGMVICGYATGAKEGYIYCRAEYPLAIRRLKVAIAQAEEYGLLGDHILGSDFSFHLRIKEGAGAFVCGEETALLASIEGRRGEPRPRPPFPAVRGLWGKPTNINNVKSYANVPRIIVNGADWFASIGTQRSTGTAIFALTGKVNNTGLVEVPMGITLGEIIFDVGDGIPNGKKFKAVQTGGPLGGCLPVEHLNAPVDFDSLKELGAVMGSGGMIVVDEDTCIVELAKFFLTFATAESCGKCVPCRMGGKRMLEVLTRITEGKGKLEDLDTIREIAAGMETGALCALGQLTPGPVMSALRYFEDEFRAHIVDKRCPAGACQALVRARCTNACPAEVDVPSYVALVAQGRYAEGLEIHRRQNPFPLICGRVCPAFCEARCRRGDIDEPVAVRAIKRFMADHELGHPWTPPIYGNPKREGVAVVGAGPAGLTAALRLAQQGYRVTVFEKLPVVGGMMAVGIPDYRLPRDVLNQEIDNIRRAGVEIQCNQALGRDFTLDELLDGKGYNAVVLAIGAHKSLELRIEGEEKEGVMHGVDFLREVALGNPPDLTGKRVGVVGGGNVAIDAVRTAWRLGASEVHVIYRRRREDMPAYAAEIEAAEEEGAVFHFLTNPTRVLGDGRVTGVECLKHTLGEFDRSGRRRPVPLSESGFVIELDVLIPAIGQALDQSWIGEDTEIKLQRNATFAVNEALGTSRPGVFAAGDAVLGPATVIQAVAQGNAVARAVDHYLRTGETEKLITLPGYEVIEQPFNLEDYADAQRPEMPELPVEERQANFREVELGMDEGTIREECKRCLRCDLEWLETMGLAYEPMPERKAVEAYEEA